MTKRLEIFISGLLCVLIMDKVPTGAEFLNNLLEGGYDTDIITTIFGPAGAGKTNFCILATVKIVNPGKKCSLWIPKAGSQ